MLFELIRVAIGTQDNLSQLPSRAEWGELYKQVKKQSLVGVCFAGLRRLGADADGGFSRIGIDEKLYLTWMGMAAKIQQRNEVVNRQCVDLQKRLSSDGFRSYIMKGQSVGSLYGGHLSGLRQSGDIDVFLEGGLEKVLAYARTFGQTTKVNELEMHVDVFPDTVVEFHYRPFIMRSPMRNRRLQRFFESKRNECMANRVVLPNGAGEIVSPTIEYNLVHLLVHTYHHLFTEGVGMRQLMDYYFVLKSLQKSDNKENVKENTKKVVHDLGLDRFASALMWVMQHVFEHSIISVPWTPNQRDGEFLLNEIMLSGNFGKQDERQRGLYDSKWNSFWIVNSKALRLARFDHWMWFWGPLWRMYHFAWRKLKGFD